MRYGRYAESAGRRRAAQLLTDCPLTGTLTSASFRACDSPPVGKARSVGFTPDGTEGETPRFERPPHEGTGPEATAGKPRGEALRSALR